MKSPKHPPLDRTRCQMQVRPAGLPPGAVVAPMQCENKPSFIATFGGRPPFSVCARCVPVVTKHRMARSLVLERIAFAEGAFIEFVEAPPKAKTRTWWVVQKQAGTHLGNVGWWARWRRYAFWPQPGTIFEEVCMRDIADFCVRMTKEHREAVKQRRGQ